MNSLFNEIEMPMIKILWQMEQHGINIDSTQLEKLGVMLNTEITKTVSEIDAITGTPINLGSPLQVGKMLVENFKSLCKKHLPESLPLVNQNFLNMQRNFRLLQKFLSTDN